LPKVNRDLAARLHGDESEEENKTAEDGEATKKVLKKKKPILTDEHFVDGRFGSMFQNPVLTYSFQLFLFDLFIALFHIVSNVFLGISFWFSGLPN
jgi:hypothetical protein